MKVRILRNDCIGWYKFCKGMVFEVYEKQPVSIYNGYGYKVKGFCALNDDNQPIMDGYILVNDCEIIKEKKMKSITIKVKDTKEIYVLVKNEDTILIKEIIHSYDIKVGEKLFLCSDTFDCIDEFCIEVIEKDLKIPHPLKDNIYLNTKIKIGQYFYYTRSCYIKTEEKWIEKDKVLFVPISALNGLSEEFRSCFERGRGSFDCRSIECGDCFYGLNNHRLWLESL